ncbi:site-specific DNA-methyltransferase [Paenibacillus shunpengii]|uniref:Site-specific DNA-methyltransferase n=1 Tax=Paenibacillus shunpengii TaxID=2054424 RepID=A0ABW5SWZ1_9BACL
MQKLEGKTFNVVQDNIEKIKELFPEVLTEKKIDIDKLRIALGEHVEKEKERYEFNWNGKTEAIQLAQKQTTGTLRPSIEESVNWDTTQNLYVEGDNLEVLRILQNSYRNKVKMIYIDPPYNTGKDFVYKDDFHDNVKSYTEQLDENMKSNAETNGRFHTDWLNMMYPRLKIARNFLTDDGVIFISIDDNEYTNLKKICDEIYGEQNFVSNIIWYNKEGGGGSDSKFFRIKHEYILCYAKSIDNLEIKGVEISNLDRYTQSDEYEKRRGPYYLQKLNQASIQYSSSLDYPIISPEGEELYPAINEKRACWRWSKEKVEWGLENGFIEFKKDKDGNWQVYSKQYLKVDNNDKPIERTQRPLSVLEGYSSTQASKKLEELFNGKVFDYSKPVNMIKTLVEISTNENDLVLDFFAGSSSTAHAIMDINANSGENRRFIMVQLPEKTDEKSQVYKLGYKNLCDVGKKRIVLAKAKIDEENGTAAKIDAGFRVFKLDETNLKKWDEESIDVEKSLLDFIEPLKEGRTKEDVVYEILLKYGIDLSVPIEEVSIAGQTVFSVGLGYLLICLERELTLNQIEEMAKQRPARIVFYDEGFKDDTVRTNAQQILKRFGVEDVRVI